jgi:hypothetical protein
MDFKTRLWRINEATLKKPYIFSFFIIFLAYLFLNIFVNQTHVTVSTLFNNNLKIIIPFIFFSVLVALLVATSINLAVIKFKELKKVNKVSGITAIGAFGGVLGGACPSCFVGLFPAFIGIFGIAASLSDLPLYGLEIQIFSAILLVVSIILLTRENICKMEVY